MQKNNTRTLNPENLEKSEKRIMATLLKSQQPETTFYQNGGILYNEEKIAFIDLKKSRLSLEEIRELGYNILT